MKIKNLLVCLLTLSALMLSSCGKDPVEPTEPTTPSNPETPEVPAVDYAAAYVGEYALDMIPAFIFEVEELGAMAIGGSAYTEDCICKIEKTTNENEVQLTLYEGRSVSSVIEGYCDENGLHLNDFAIKITFIEYDEELGEAILDVDLNLKSTTIDRPYEECLGFSCVTPIISANSVSITAMDMTVPLSGTTMGSITFEGTRL